VQGSALTLGKQRERTSTGHARIGKTPMRARKREHADYDMPIAASVLRGSFRVGLAELLGALFAAHFHYAAADGDLDGRFVQRVIARGTGFFFHGYLLK
jgi:hypothetical protein